MSIRSDALSIARGDVRDGIAAIEHFREVLTSRRVAPRMVMRAIPEIRSGREPLIDALHALENALATEMSEDVEGFADVRAMLANAAARVDELAAALDTYAGANVDARVRLALESIVRRVCGELGATLRLIDMLGAPATLDTVTIDLGDALHARGTRKRRGTPGPTIVEAPVELRTDELVVGDARLLLDLIERAIGWVVHAGEKCPRVVVEKGPEGFPLFTITGGVPTRAATSIAKSPAPLVFEATLHDELPREPGVVRAAARHAGITVTISDDVRTVTIAL